MTRALVTPVRPKTDPLDRDRSYDPGQVDITVTVDRMTSAIARGGQDPIDRRPTSLWLTVEADPGEAPPSDAELWFG